MEQMRKWQQELRRQLDKISTHIREMVDARQESLPLASQPILSPDLQKVETGLVRIFQKIEKGLQSLVTLLSELHHTADIEHLPGLIHAIGDMVTVASVVMQNSHPALHLLSQGGSLQEVLGVAESTLHSLYTLSRYLYEQQHYEEASGAFCLLALLNPSYAAFWQGLGNCSYFLGQYQEALLAYSLALEIDPHDALCQILIAKAHLALGNYAAAKASVMMVDLSEVEMHQTGLIQKQKEEILLQLRKFL